MATTTTFSDMLNEYTGKKKPTKKKAKSKWSQIVKKDTQSY